MGCSTNLIKPVEEASFTAQKNYQQYGSEIELIRPISK